MYQLSVTLNAKLDNVTPPRFFEESVVGLGNAWDSRAKRFFEIVNKRVESDLGVHTANIVWPSANEGSIDLEGFLFLVFHSAEAFALAVNIIQSTSYVEEVVRNAARESYGTNTIIRQVRHTLTGAGVLSTIGKPSSFEPSSQSDKIAPSKKIALSSPRTLALLAFISLFIIFQGYAFLSDRAKAEEHSEAIARIEDYVSTASGAAQCPSVTLNNYVGSNESLEIIEQEQASTPTRIRLFKNGKEYFN